MLGNICDLLQPSAFQNKLILTMDWQLLCLMIFHV